MSEAIVNVKADTGQAVTEIRKIGEEIERLPITSTNNKNQPITNSNAPSPFNENSNQSPIQSDITQSENKNYPINRNFEEFNDAFPKFLESIKVASDALSKIGSSSKPSTIPNKPEEKKQKNDNNFFKTAGLTTAITAAISGAFAYNTYEVRKQIKGLNADVYGIERETYLQRQNIANSATSFLPVAGALVGSLVPGVGTIAGTLIGQGLQVGVNTFTNSYIGNKTAKIDYEEARANLYGSRLDYLDRALFQFGTPGSIQDNKRQETNLDRNFLNASKNTGLTVRDFAEYSMSLGRYGINNQSKANDLTRTAAFVGRNTNTDIDTILSVMGQQERLGYDSKNSINKAYSAAINTGLSDEQFAEFLQGLGQTVEQGIARGYKTSTEDVSKQILMFGKLSNNDPLWTGKYAAQNLNTINTGMANATNLESSVSKLAFVALKGSKEEGGASIKGESLLNTLSLMEAGLTTGNFKALAKTFGNAYGNDTQQEVAAWKELSGLNWTGSMKLQQMASKYREKGLEGDEFNKKIEEEINALKGDKQYLTEQTKMITIVEEIKTKQAFMASDAYIDKFKKVIELNDSLSRKEPITNTPTGYKEKTYRTINDLFDIEGLSEKDETKVFNKWAELQTNDLNIPGSGPVVEKLRDLNKDVFSDGIITTEETKKITDGIMDLINLLKQSNLIKTDKNVQVVRVQN